MMNFENNSFHSFLKTRKNTNLMVKPGVKPYTKCDFLKGQLPKYFFLKICSSGGKQTIHKVSAASTVRNCHPRTSLIDFS